MREVLLHIVGNNAVTEYAKTGHNGVRKSIKDACWQANEACVLIEMVVESASDG